MRRVAVLTVLFAWWFMSWDSDGGLRTQGPFATRELCDEFRGQVQQLTRAVVRVTPCWSDGKLR